MTDFWINALRSGNLPAAGARLAEVDELGQVHLWPEGLGVGPHILFEGPAWERMCKEVILAHVRRNNNERNP